MNASDISTERLMEMIDIGTYEVEALARAELDRRRQAKSCDNCYRGPKNSRACSERPCFSYSRWLAKPTAQPEQAKVEGQVRYWRGKADPSLVRKTVDGTVVEVIDNGFVRDPKSIEMRCREQCNNEITAAEYAEAKAKEGKVWPYYGGNWWCPTCNAHHPNGMRCDRKPAPEVNAIEPLEKVYDIEKLVLSGNIKDDVYGLWWKQCQIIEQVNRLTEWKRSDEALMEYAIRHSPEEVVAETKRIFADRLTAGREMVEK